MSDEKDWRIAWRSRRTGETGHEEAIFSEDDARSYAAILNDDPNYYAFHHWAEQEGAGKADKNTNEVNGAQNPSPET
jgi:hypothetical protein